MPLHFMKSILLLALTPVFTASAAHLAYWQFDDGTSGAASTVVSEINSPAVNGAASGNGSGGLAPTFNSSTPGAVITNGVGGAILNASNTSSLSFDNGPSGVFSATTQTGGIVNVPGTSFQSASFTIEGFIRVNPAENSQFSTIFGKIRSGATGSALSWQLDTNATGLLRARFDSQAFGTSSGAGSNQSINTTGSYANDTWRHVALTYDGTTRSARIFLDYTDVGGGTVTNPLVYDASNVIIASGGNSGGAARAFNGLIDEVRYTDSVLSSGDFLRAATPVGDYASWATAHGIAGESAAEDFDNDGLTNIIEYALGLDPKSSDVPAGTLEEGVLTFIKGTDAIASFEVGWVIQQSTDLSTWTDAVTQAAGNPAASISYTLPTGQGKVFARLKAVQTP